MQTKLLGQTFSNEGCQFSFKVSPTYIPIAHIMLHFGGYILMVFSLFSLLELTALTLLAKVWAVIPPDRAYFFLYLKEDNFQYRIL